MLSYYKNFVSFFSDLTYYILLSILLYKIQHWLHLTKNYNDITKFLSQFLLDWHLFFQIFILDGQDILMNLKIWAGGGKLPIAQEPHRISVCAGGSHEVSDRPENRTLKLAIVLIEKRGRPIWEQLLKLGGDFLHFSKDVGVWGPR